MSVQRERMIGSLMTLATLMLGGIIGFAAKALYSPHQQVNAQGITQPQQSNIKEVSPGFTTGQIGTNLILAHEIAADTIVVNGFDTMKLQQNVLNYLATRPTAEKADIENLILASRPAVVYRMKQPQSAPTPPPPTEKK